MISTGVLYALILIFGFIGIMVLLDKFDLLEPLSMELSGPFLMWKTKRGRDLIDRIAEKKRFWEIYGSIGIVIVAIAMVIIFIMVAFNAYVATQIPAEQAPQADEILVIPGINPFIPIGYGILSLAVGIIVHEFSHGILSRVADVDIKSLGLIFIVVPLGAFVEPDEDQLEKTERIKRDRMYAAGATSNIILAIILVIIFSTIFMGSVSTREDGPMIMNIAKGSPADEAGMSLHKQIWSIEGNRTKDQDDLNSINIQPNKTVKVTVLKGKEFHTYNVTAGLVITGILKDYPAHDAGLKSGDIISEVDGELIKNSNDLSSLLAKKDDDDELNITYHRKEDGEYREQDSVNLTLKNGRIGINMGYLGVTTQEGDWLIQLLSKPLSGAETGTELLQNAASYIAMPLFGLSPVPEEIVEQYEVNGPLSILPSSSFWTIANSLYWIFWLNILLGLFNALPAIPLDGGHLFRDWIKGLSEGLGLNEEIGEKVSSGMSYALALLVLFLLMWSMIGPRI
ncbi:MAG: site-2 protease family protein [Candidatus Thermoplasmatota archaeon]|nr:site-2 protease family protein [Candidatus Thermoplasmatota archaeon]